MDRLKELKAKQVAGTLTAEEQKELAKLETKAEPVTLGDVAKAVSEAVGTAVKEGMQAELKTLNESIKENKSAAVVQEVGNKQSFAEVLKGIVTRDKRLIDKYQLKSASKVFEGEEKALSEGTPAAGGFLVPTEQSNKIMQLVKEKSIIRGLATVWPMNSRQLTVPKVSNGATAYWIDEAALKTDSTPTFAQMVLTAYKLCCISVVSDELLADANPAVDSILYELFALAIVRGEETAFLQGAAGVGDPITGIYNTAGITTLAASGNLLDDMADLIGAVEENEGENVAILHALREKRQLRKLKDDDGQYIYQMPANPSTPATIWDARAYGNKYIPKTLGATADESYAIAGDFAYAAIGDRSGIVIDADKSRYFEYDQTAFRAVKRVGFGIGDATKFARVTGIRVI
jgi:HK97 family phage major capsid protein